MEDYFTQQRFRLDLYRDEYSALLSKDCVSTEQEGLLYQIVVRPEKAILKQLIHFGFTREKYLESWVTQLLNEGFAFPHNPEKVISILLSKPVKKLNVRNLQYLIQYLDDPVNLKVTKQLSTGLLSDEGLLPHSLSAEEEKEEERLVYNERGLLVDPTKDPDYDPFEGLESSHQNGDPSIFGNPIQKRNSN